MVKSSAVNTDILLSLDSSKARRIFTLNTHEEKRLEKVRWNLEKQRMAETKKFLKAKKDIIIHHFGFWKVHSAGQVSVQDRLLKMSSDWKTSQELLPCLRSGHLDLQRIFPAKDNSDSKEAQNGDTYCSDSATFSFSVPPHMRRILASEGNLSLDLVQLCQGWSSSARPKFRCLENKEDNDTVITKRPNTQAQENFIHQSPCDNKLKETPLSEVLAPIRLPPLHSQKEKTIKGKRHATLIAMTDRKEKLWNGLEDCRYLRTYEKTK